MKIKRKSLALLMVVMLVFNGLGTFAVVAPDLIGHWSQTIMTDWMNKGWISGYPGGTVKPDNKITRAEFMTIVNKSFGLTGFKTVNFTDVKSTDWYVGAIAVALSNGYIGGYPDGTMKPNAPISRAEAAVIIAKVTKLTSDTTTAGYYNDSSSIPTWALGSVGAVTKAGIMSGYTGGLFGPTRSITRAETVAALNKAIVLKTAGMIYDVAGTYGTSTTQTINGDVQIKAASVTLKNMIITGSLKIDKAVGNGNVTLTNVVVQGQIYVEGGGSSSIHFDGVTASTVTANRVDGMVRIVADGKTRIDTVYVKEDTRLEEDTDLTGNGFMSVRIESDAPSGTKLDLVHTKLDSLYLKAKSSNITMDSNCSTTKVTVSGASNTLTGVTGTSISTLVADAAVTVTGAGTITKAEINASGCSFDIKPTTMTVKSGVSQPSITGFGVESWTPAKDAKDVAIDSNIVIKFSDTVRLVAGEAALTNSNVDALLTLRLKSSTGTKVAFDATVTTTSGKTVITIDPTEDLTVGQLYYVAFEGDDLENDEDDDIIGDTSITFTTIDSGAPTVKSFEPANAATNVALDANIVITFSEKVRKITGDADLSNSNVDDLLILKKTNASGANVSFDATVSTVSSRTVITINPSSELTGGQVYYVAVKDNVLEDYSNIKLSGTKSATFTAITSAAPQVETFVPASGASNVSLSNNLTMTFNKEVRLTNDTALTSTNVDALVVLKETNSSGASQAFDATVAVSGGKTIITVNPTGDLKPNQVYYLSITGLEDTLNQALTGTKSITFTTMASGAPVIESYSPILNGAIGANVVVTFSKVVRAEDNTTLTNANVATKANIVFKKNNASGADVAYVPTVETVGNKTVITLNPNANLASGSVYYVAFNGLKDSSDQALGGNKSFDFTTAPIAVTSVDVTSTSSTITTTGGTLQMTATVAPTEATNKEVTWSVVSGTGTATISSGGLLTAVSNGTVTVRATSVSNTAIKGEMTITLSNQAIVAQSVVVSSEGNAITIDTMGGTLQFSTTVAPTDTTNKDVTWSVIPGTGTATINSSGLLTAVSNGTVTVRATSVSNTSAKGDMTITLSNQAIAVQSISISSDGSATTIETMGGTLQFTASVMPTNATNKAVTWTVIPGSGTATINSSGLLTAVSNGTVTVKATSVSNGAVNDQMNITLSNQAIPVSSITVTGEGGATTITSKGGTLQLSAEVLPADATNPAIAWSVEEIGGRASISDSGELTAEEDGTVRVRATSVSTPSVTGTLMITISGQSIAVTTLEITGASDISTPAGTCDLDVTVTPNDATDSTVTWAITSGNDFADINNSGVVTGKANGTITVTVTSVSDPSVTDNVDIVISGQ